MYYFPISEFILQSTDELQIFTLIIIRVCSTLVVRSLVN